MGDVSLSKARSLLQLLIHRGQDASGLSWVDQYNVHQTQKVKGSPAEIAIGDELVNTVIGSTRYPTLGDRMGDVSEKKFAQPFSYQTKLGTLSLCHNGNITNLSQLSSDPSKYQSDAEFITKFLGQLINEHGSLEEGLINISKYLDGAFSLVGILGKRMFAFRDPRGIRPLVHGTNGIHYVFASESLVLQQAGISVISDVKPGELVSVSLEGYRTQQLVPAQKIAHCYFEYVYFASSVSTINGKNVYATRLKLGHNLSMQLLEKGIQSNVDFVVPVPDTSKAAAETIAENLDRPLREAIMKNRSSNRTFIMPSEDARKTAALSKYLLVEEFIRGKNLLLVDDSIVRGLTMSILVQILREQGCGEIHVAIPCPPQRYPCYYGVDFGTDQELIARNNKSENEICKEIGADSLTYLSLENLKKSISLPNLCDACLTGQYPTPHGQKLRLKVLSGDLDQEKSHYE